MSLDNAFVLIEGAPIFFKSLSGRLGHPSVFPIVV